MSDWYHAFTDAVNKITIKSVVDSPGRMLLLSLGLFLLAAIFVSQVWILIFFAVVVGVILVMILVSYFYCLFTNPDLLRSEDYNIRKQSIEVLGDKDNYLPIDSKHLASIANPYSEVKQIEAEVIADED